MRLWSLHPKLLDRVGLVALWREGLLAKKVIEGGTKGYKHHPQLLRFLSSPHSLDAINYYLVVVAQEALRRGYNFNTEKINSIPAPECKIDISDSQRDFEFQHLLQKCILRDKSQYTVLVNTAITLHPLFELVHGPVATWEKIS